MDWSGLALIVTPGAVLSGGLLWWASRIDRALVASQDWPSTEAEILESAISDQHVPSIRYRYTVDGVAHVSQQISFLPGALPPAEAAAFTTNHPVGATVLCHYPPERPGHAVLSRTGNVRNLRRAAYAIAGVFTLVLLLVIIRTA